MIKLKSIEAVEFFIAESGKIGIKQDSFVHGKSVEVFITLEQFVHLQLMVNDFKEDIIAAWNEGVDNE